MNHDEFEYNYDEDSSWDEGVVVDNNPPYSVFEKEVIPADGMIRSPMSPRLDGVNLGTTIVFEANSDGYPVPASEWLDVGSLDPDFSLVALQRVLTVKPQDLQSQAPGSWVVSLSGKIIELSSAANPNGFSEYCPLVAKVTYGSGGASQYFLVDAWRSIFSVPSNNFIVEVGWLKPAAPGIAVTAQPIIIPDVVEMTATAHRSLETGEAIPTVTYILNSQFAVAPNEIVMAVPIPPQAVSWCLGSRFPIPLGSAILNTNIQLLACNYGGTGNPFAYDSVDNTTIVGMLRSRCFREIPSAARLIYFDIDTSALAEPMPCFSLTFRLGV